MANFQQTELLKGAGAGEQGDSHSAHDRMMIILEGNFSGGVVVNIETRLDENRVWQVARGADGSKASFILPQPNYNLVGITRGSQLRAVTVGGDVSTSVTVIAVETAFADGQLPGIATFASAFNPAGGLDVNIQDQHSRSFDVFFSQVVGELTALEVSAVINEWDITLETGHGVAIGEQLVIYDFAADRLYVGGILNVVTDVITLDTPLNFSYPAATSVVACTTRELNVNGAIERQTFAVAPPLQSAIDITRIMFQMTTVEFPELDMFGDIEDGLLRGIVLRVVNGINVNYFNVKTNGELVNLMFDVDFYEAAKHGVNGLGGRLTYAGPSKHGVTIRLGTDDSLEIIIQDDLRSITKFRMIASGHVVED